ncbi:MAG: YdcF family protein [Candidatus Paceibacterota bacterium]
MDRLEALKVVLEYLTQEVPERDLPVADLIFVHGYNNRIVAEHAAHLFCIGKASHVVVTGGIGPMTSLPSGYGSEAEYFKDIMCSRGVPKDAVVTECRSTNTKENVLYGIDEVDRFGITMRRIIAVALPPLLRRSFATFQKHAPNLEVFGSAPRIPISVMSQSQQMKRICGEIDRLEQYALKGDIAPTEIPPHVKEAHRFLTSLP